MSRGYGAAAVLEMQDEKTAMYRYGNYNWNLEGYDNPEHLLDGWIWIEKSALPQPEIHERIRRQPNGKKKRIVKRIPRQLDGAMLRSGQIQIENSRFCWLLLEGNYDRMAVHLLWKISDTYQQTGSLPERVCLAY